MSLLFMSSMPLLASETIEEISVVGITPDAAATLALRKVPYAVQKAVFADLQAARTLDLSDYMNNGLGSTMNIQM